MLRYNHFISLLSFLSSIIPPLGAVMIMDYFFLNRKAYAGAFSEAKFAVVNVPAVLAVVAGGIFGHLPAGIGCLNAVFGAMLTYGIFTEIKVWLVRRREERAAAGLRKVA